MNSVSFELLQILWEPFFRCGAYALHIIKGHVKHLSGTHLRGRVIVNNMDHGKVGMSSSMGLNILLGEEGIFKDTSLYVEKKTYAACILKN